MKKLDYIVAAGFGLLAAILYSASCAGFAFPGESAQLLCVWQGINTASCEHYPLMGAMARMLGGGNAIAPVCGVAAAALMYLWTVRFLRRQMNGEYVADFRTVASRLAGVTATLVLMLTPAVRSAASHAEPRLFQMVWLLAALWVLDARIEQKALKWPARMLGAAMWGMGAADSFLFLAALPLVVLEFWRRHGGRRKKFSLEMGVFLPVALIAFLCVLGKSGDMGESLKFLSGGAKAWVKTPGWMWVFFLSVVPFGVSLFSCNVAFNKEPGWMQWIFHIAMSLASVLAVATPASAGSLMADAGILPVVASACAAFTSGYLAAYWFVLTRARVRINESRDDVPVALMGRMFGIVAGSILAGVYVVALAINLFRFDGLKGEFADRMAEAILDDMGGKKWLVTDGTLDNHLKMAIRRKGLAVRLIELSRDLDAEYLKELQGIVRDEKIGGERCEELALSLKLGVLSFVRDWFEFAPETAGEVAIYGAPDLWYAAGKKPVPEACFFTAEGTAARRDETDVRAVREKMLSLLPVKKGWGSLSILKTKNPVERMRLELRRHLGFVANDRGVYLQDNGEELQAFETYEQVLDEIDNDNLCALFNLFEMTRGRFAQAIARKDEYDRRIKLVVEDNARRYKLWSLANYYGYIRSPEIFIRLGFAWARSGRPGEALNQIRRAIDFVPSDRKTVLLNMMASLYASEDERAKSRKVYEYVLHGNENDHDALIGMMRLSLLDGDSEAALRYLEKATAQGGDSREIRVELAMVKLMKNDLSGAKEILRGLTDEDGADMRAWSLLAAVTMQQSDAEKDAQAKIAFDKELEDVILPQMEKNTTNANDYYVQTTKAFLLMRKGAEARRAARDALAKAARMRPDAQATQDLVLGLDISLADEISAEKHAREILLRDRKHPLANYVMGAMALRQGEYREAELYLKRSADHERAVVLAMNDLAEIYRRQKNWDEAERYARKAVATDPRLYVAYETLGSVLMDRGGDLAEAEANVKKACELSKDGNKDADIRMVMSLARVQLLGGHKQEARASLRKVELRKSELSDFELGEFEELKKRAR